MEDWNDGRDDKSQGALKWIGWEKDKNGLTNDVMMDIIGGCFENNSELVEDAWVLERT